MKKYYFIAFIIGVAIGCNKVDVQAPDDFTVTTAKTTYTTKDTIVFNVTGNPDYITFYSGEAHNKYEYSLVNSMKPDSNILAFSTTTTAPGATTQPLTVNNLLLMTSTNFSGVYDSANIKKATWTDISSKAKFATTTTTVASGNIRVDDLKPASDTTPLYFAFKYFSDTTKTGYLSRQWVLNSFGLKSYFKDTTYALASNFTTGGFFGTSILNATNIWSYTNTSSITTSMTFKAGAVGNLPDEDWVISRAFNLSLYPSDLGVQIKTMSDKHFTEYKKQRPYSTPGTYVVTFVAKNQSGETSQQTIRQVTLTITP